MDRTTNRLHFVLLFGKQVLSDCDFANDIAFVCTFAAELEEVLTTLLEEASKVGLKIIWQKTNIMIIDTACATLNSTPLSLLGYTVEFVKSFMYFGSVITDSKSIEAET